MKTNITRTFTILLIAFFIIMAGGIVNKTNADYNNSYTNYAFYTGGDKQDNTSYKIVKIYVPENIEWLEWRAMTGQLNANSYEFKLIYLNALLIKKGLESIY